MFCQGAFYGKGIFPPGPSQARSQQRHEKTLDVAANSFYEKRLGGIATDEIAVRADISIGSLYQYFDGEEAIVEALHGVTADVVTTIVEDLPTAPTVDRLHDPIIAFHFSDGR
jgi:AcrR family transcriptional regulator